jgi:DNA-binding protein Fis
MGTIAIELVPLSHRAEDIPMLAQAMLERPSRENRVAGFDTTALQMLGEYRWPGNLDQLSWVVTQSGQNLRDRLLGTEDLPEKFHHWLRAQQLSPSAEVSIDLDRYLESIERELILRAMGQAKGNKTQAAKQLGLSRAKLLRRIENLNLENELTHRTPIATEDDQSEREGDSDKNSFSVSRADKDENVNVAGNPRPSKLRAKLLARPIPEKSDVEKEESDLNSDDDWLSPEAFEEVD